VGQWEALPRLLIKYYPYGFPHTDVILQLLYYYMNYFVPIGGKPWHCPSLSPNVAKLLRVLVDQYGCSMYEFKSGKVYLVFEHYRYLDWKQKAKRVLIGKGTYPLQYLYLYKGHDLLL
jgi:hypothetical protein